MDNYKTTETEKGIDLVKMRTSINQIRILRSELNELLMPNYNGSAFDLLLSNGVSLSYANGNNYISFTKDYHDLVYFFLDNRDELELRFDLSEKFHEDYSFCTDDYLLKNADKLHFSGFASIDDMLNVCIKSLKLAIEKFKEIQIDGITSVTIKKIGGKIFVPS